MNSHDMTNGPFLKNIIKYSLPLMATGILQIVYSAADLIVVGRFSGSTSLAAVGSTVSLVNLFMNLFIGLSAGTNVAVATLLGAQDKHSISKTVHTAILFSFLCGIIVAITGFFVSLPLLHLMKSPDDVINLSALYLKIFFLGTPGNLVFNFGAAILRAQGDTKRPFLILSTTGLINVILNLILVIFFKMDVAGVAIATIVSQYISAICILVILCNLKNDCRLKLSELHIHLPQLAKIISIGLPAGLQSTMFSISNVLIQSTVNSFGSIAMAGYSASLNIDGVLWVSANSISQTCMTFSSQNYGAKKIDNIKKVYNLCLAYTSIFTLFLSAIALIFKQQILSLFTKDPLVMERAIERTWWLVSLYFICGTMDVAGNQLRAIGKSFTAMILTLIGTCVLRVFWILVIFPFHPTLPNVYISYPLSWIATFIVLHICVCITHKKIFQNKKSAL